MSLYVLVEGKTEGVVYPQWLSYLLSSFDRISVPSDAVERNYYLISCGGYPGILDNFLKNSIGDVNESANFTHLVVVIDSDDLSAEEKTKEVYDYILENEIELINCKLVVIAQTVCMETWFLGNRKIYSRNSQDVDCSRFANHFDVSRNDPEEMQKYSDYKGTNADFHFSYLKKMLREKNIRYSKSRPQGVGEKHYVDELQKRVRGGDGSLKSLGYFFDFIDELST